MRRDNGKEVLLWVQEGTRVGFQDVNTCGKIDRAGYLLRQWRGKICGLFPAVPGRFLQSGGWYGKSVRGVTNNTYLGYVIFESVFARNDLSRS